MWLLVGLENGFLSLEPSLALSRHQESICASTMNVANPMGRIIYCSDLILRIDDPGEEIANVTEWIRASTEFSPAYPEGCVVRHEVGEVKGS